jgi:hypothetical protein
MIENFVKGKGFKTNAELSATAANRAETSQGEGLISELPPAVRGATDAVDDFRKQVISATEALTNVPAGYKVAYARFQATAAAAVMGHKSDNTDFAGLADARGAITIRIDNLTLKADNPQDFWEQLRREAFRKTGAAFPTGH